MGAGDTLLPLEPPFPFLRRPTKFMRLRIGDERVGLLEKRDSGGGMGREGRGPFNRASLSGVRVGVAYGGWYAPPGVILGSVLEAEAEEDCSK